MSLKNKAKKIQKNIYFDHYDLNIPAPNFVEKP